MNNKYAKPGFISAFFGAVLALSALTVAQEALAQAATVTFASGNVSITGANGASRAARRGSEVNAGETVNTAAASWAQLKFSDGAMTSLQPETGFKIDEYQFKGTADGSERGFFSLLKGAMRTVTGAIGHGAQRDNYRVKTATATIGIRGTEFLMRLGNGLFVSVGNGRVALFNDAGELILGPGQTGFVRDAKTFPQLVMQKPLVGAPQLREEIRFVAAEQRSGEAGSTALGDDHHSSSGGSGGGGLSFFAAGILTTGGATDLSAGADFNGAGADYQVVASGNELQAFKYFTFNGTLDTATALEHGSVGGLSYGRWTTPGATASGFNIGAATDPQVAYLFGNRTVPLPTTGSISLSPAGGTSPFNAAGVTGSFSGGTVSLDFGQGKYSFAGLNFAVGGANYTMTSAGFQLYGSDGRFSNTNNFGTCAGGGCGSPSGLTSAWSGLITNNGNTFGINYAIQDPASANKAVMGVQVFTPGGI